MLNLTRKLSHLRTFLFIGRRDVDGRRMVQRIDHHISLPATLAFILN
jgi:hypothetical protein